MAAQTLSLMARSQQDLETMTMSYIAQGYMVANKTPWQVTLIKPKQFSWVLLIILVFFVWTIIAGVVLLIYLIVYASQSDQMVVITVASAPQMAPTGYLPAAPVSYETAPRSPDGYYWWDGQTWQLVPQAGQTGPMGQPNTGPMGQPPTGPSQWPPTGPMAQPPTGPYGY